MSALSDGQSDASAGSVEFSFKQPVAIPSYLVALAVGRLESRDVGPRSKVWAEPSVVEAAANEFADTESFIAEGEKLLSKYVWTRYDVLCMPPSFPYGGMENPCLTFVTPTLLAGDRSLADVICHEIAHSWTGNLVTTRNWEHFWLNEGCTMWVQRKIMQKLHGAAFFDFDAMIGLKMLQDDVEHLGATNPLTALVPKLADVDPDDAFSGVPYEKGKAGGAESAGSTWGSVCVDVVCVLLVYVTFCFHRLPVPLLPADCCGWASRVRPLVQVLHRRVCPQGHHLGGVQGLLPRPL